MTVQGPQTMNIAAGAFIVSGGDPVLAFSGTFCYAITPLQVIYGLFRLLAAHSHCQLLATINMS